MHLSEEDRHTGLEERDGLDEVLDERT